MNTDHTKITGRTLLQTYVKQTLTGDKLKRYYTMCFNKYFTITLLQVRRNR